MIFLVYVLTRTRTPEFNFAHAHSLDIVRNLILDLASDFALASVFDLVPDQESTIILERVLKLGLHRAIDYAHKLTRININHWSSFVTIVYSLDAELQIADIHSQYEFAHALSKALNPAIVHSLECACAIAHAHTLDRTHSSDLTNALAEILKEYFGIDSLPNEIDWFIDDKQITEISSYLNANRLLLDCLKLSVVQDPVAIMALMFVPLDEKE